jgi:thiamine biosynthesis lipoprotein
MTTLLPEATVSVSASRTYMDTHVSIELVGRAAGCEPAKAIAAAFAWFREVERRCSRFDRESELMRLCETVAVPVKVSELLFAGLDFALSLAVATDGAFDPTVGRLMETRGFDRNYQTGLSVQHAAAPGAATFRDVELDRRRRTVLLRRPLVLDLGAVAKGLAIDLAAQALRSFPGFAVDAGGDLCVGGASPDGKPWRVGIHHPRRPAEIIEVVEVSDRAVCTSGDYERRGSGGAGHHLLDARTGTVASRVASATAIAPMAMLADSLTTAVFALGPEAGIALLERQRVEGMVLTPALECYETSGFGRYRR